MYNTDLPRRADLPTSGQLMRSTLIAMTSAAVLLATVVLPSEYAIDPTGIGRLFGLTQMGEIKVQLANEAATDAAAPLVDSAPTSTGEASILARLDQIEVLLTAQRAVSNPLPVGEPSIPDSSIESLVAIPPVPVPAPLPGPEMAAGAPPVTAFETAAVSSQAGRSDEVSFVLPPGEGAEVKLVMTQGARANFAWTANGAVVNFDTHGDGGGQSVSYEKGRSIAEDDGILEAAFDGNHGWFWRNRTSGDVTVSLSTNGDYTDFKRLK